MGVCIPMKKPNDCDYCKLYTDRYGEDLGIDFYCIVKDVQSDACPLIDIVTCGECKYWYRNKPPIDEECDIFPNADDFCPYGERRSK